MSINSVNVIANMEMAPEIREALVAVHRPEVRELIKELSKYHLGVCVPHMHRPDIDFDALPDDTVQVEENCVVRWVQRSELDLQRNHVPVAWRWVENGPLSDVECSSTCAYTSNGHKKTGHI